MSAGGDRRYHCRPAIPIDKVPQREVGHRVCVDTENGLRADIEFFNVDADEDVLVKSVRFVDKGKSHVKS